MKPSERSKPGSSEHIEHCFIVMPFGRTSKERKWFKGWYEVVIKPAVASIGLKPVLSAAEEQPGAINDEMRAHLTFDPMVVVDLGGFDADAPPNPNVMYELGIRHALGLPPVMMSLEGQELPFDVSRQRVIIGERDLLNIETSKQKLSSFIQAAAEGKYYRPMDAVGRHAAIDYTVTTLDEGNLIGALAYEVRDLRATVAAVALQGRRWPRRPKIRTLKSVIGSKINRKPLYAAFSEAGGAVKMWTKLLRTPVDDEYFEEITDWTEDDWLEFVVSEARQPTAENADQKDGDEKTSVADSKQAEIARLISDDSFIERVFDALPSQPWPSGVHRAVAEELDAPRNAVWRAIGILIERRKINPQYAGVVYVPAEDLSQKVDGGDP